MQEWQAREEQTLSKWLKKNGFKDVDDLKTKLADARNRQDREMISLINSRPRKRSFPAENRMQEHVQKLQERIHDIESRMRIREENKTVALGTSKINYMDPRITVAWCKKVSVPLFCSVGPPWWSWETFVMCACTVVYVWDCAICMQVISCTFTFTCQPLA